MPLSLFLLSHTGIKSPHPSIYWLWSTLLTKPQSVNNKQQPTTPNSYQQQATTAVTISRLSHTNLSPLPTLTLITALEYNTLCLQIPIYTANWKMPVDAQIRATLYPLWSQHQNTSLLPLYALYPANYKILPHSTLTVSHNKYKPICLRHYRSSPSLSSPAASFDCPSTTNFKCHAIIATHHLFWPKRQTTYLFLPILMNTCHTTQNSLASLLRLQQKSTSRIQKSLHSTSTLPQVQPLFQVKHMDASLP